MPHHDHDSHTDCHEHSHSHGHAHDNDKTLGHAMLVFGLFGLLQFATALLGGRIALAVDGLHNMGEVPTLGVNRWARRQQGKKRSRFITCWLLPLTPAITAVMAIASAVAIIVIEPGHTKGAGVWVACGLAVISFWLNGYFANRLHAGHDHGDADSFAAKMHLIGDKAASGIAALAYGFIGVTGQYALIDTCAAIAGTVIIVVVHYRPIKNSFVELRRHRGVHDCVNGALS